MLEDHRDVFAADLAQRGRIRLGDVGAEHFDRSRGRRPQAVERADERRLAGAGESHDDEDLSGLDLEVRIDDGGCAELRQLVAVRAFFEALDDFVLAFAEDLVDM